MTQIQSTSLPPLPPLSFLCICQLGNPATLPVGSAVLPRAACVAPLPSLSHLVKEVLDNADRIFVMLQPNAQELPHLTSRRNQLRMMAKHKTSFISFMITLTC